MVNRDNFESVVDYNTVLTNFEGPLDLLLFLINKEEIEIEDIFISQVTEQFLQYMKGLPALDVDKVSEYLNIAATILKIKAQSLVPNRFDEGDEMWEEYEDEVEGEKRGLIQALEEYKLIKEESVKLKELETIGYFFKEPDKDVGTTKTVFTLDKLTLDGLVKAFSEVMMKRESRINSNETREIPRDTFTVAEKIKYIMDTLEDDKKMSFEELFPPSSPRSEIVTTFQAMLELLKYQMLFVSQQDMFGEITIMLNPERNKEETFGEIDEYD